MGKVLFVFGLLLCPVCFASAQKVEIGARAGVNFSSNHFGSDNGRKVDWKTGVNLGALALINVSESFFIQPGLFWSMKGSKSDKQTQIGVSRAYQKDEYRLHYLELPVSAGYRFNVHRISLMFYAGPYAAVGVGGKHDMAAMTTGADGPEATLQEKTDAFGVTDGPKREDFGLNFGAGVRQGNLYLGIQYDLGLYDFMPGSATLRNRNLSLNLGYYF